MSRSLYNVAAILALSTIGTLAAVDPADLPAAPMSKKYSKRGRSKTYKPNGAREIARRQKRAAAWKSEEETP